MPPISPLFLVLLGVVSTALTALITMYLFIQYWEKTRSARLISNVFDGLQEQLDELKADNEKLRKRVSGLEKALAVQTERGDKYEHLYNQLKENGNGGGLV